MCLELEIDALKAASRKTRTAWTLGSDRLLKTRSLSFAYEWALAVFQQTKTALELACQKVYQALESSTDARWSHQSFVPRVFLLDWMCLDPGLRSRHMRLPAALLDKKLPSHL
jgi:hypothetical protein